MTRRVRFSDVVAATESRALAPGPKRDVKAALRGLALDPSGITTGLDVRPLSVPDDRAPVYRLRVGDWRVAFVFDGRDIEVTRVFHRSEGYSWMERDLE